jgi:Domain of unknown function (DUF4160)
MSKEGRLKRHVLELRRKLSYAEVGERYRRLAEEDRRNNRHRRYRLVRKLPSVSVRMDGTKNHNRPHLHISIGKKSHAASIAIDNGEILVGRRALSRTEEREVQEWVLSHTRALLRLWEEMQAGRPVDALICELQEEDDVYMPPRALKRPKSQ